MKLRGPRFDMVGSPVVSGRGSQVGVTIITKDNDMAKAESNGVYVMNGHRYKIKAGDALPDGATFEAAKTEPEQKAQDKAPDNKALPNAPQNKSKA